MIYPYHDVEINLGGGTNPIDNYDRNRPLQITHVPIVPWIFGQIGESELFHNETSIKINGIGVGQNFARNQYQPWNDTTDQSSMPGTTERNPQLVNVYAGIPEEALPLGLQ